MQWVTWLSSKAPLPSCWHFQTVFKKLSISFYTCLSSFQTPSSWTELMFLFFVSSALKRSVCVCMCVCVYKYLISLCIVISNYISFWNVPPLTIDFLGSESVACTQQRLDHYYWIKWIVEWGGSHDSVGFVCFLFLVAKWCPTLVTTWTVSCRASLSMGFSRQAYWSGLPFPTPGDLPHPRIEPVSPALAGGFFAI